MSRPAIDQPLKTQSVKIGPLKTRSLGTMFGHA